MAKSMRVNRNKKYSKKRRTNNRVTSRKSARRASKRNSRRNNKKLRGGIRGGANEEAKVAAINEKIAELGRAIASLEGKLEENPNDKPAQAELAGTKEKLAAAQAELAAAEKALGERPTPALNTGSAPAGAAGAVFNPLYGNITKEQVMEISADNYGEVVMKEKTVEQSQEMLRTGSLVLLGVLIQQLELEKGERDEEKLKAAARELLRHIELIETQLDAKEEGYGKELFGKLSSVLTTIGNTGSADLQAIDVTLFNLKQAFAILDAKDREAYEEIKQRAGKNESIYDDSPDKLAAKIKSETEKARDLGIYIQILQTEPEQEAAPAAPKTAPNTAAATAAATGGTYVFVEKEGNNYKATIVNKPPAEN